MITKIESIDIDDDKVFVRAVVEDMMLIYPQSLYDPPEYGAALCESSFTFDQEEILPLDNERELIELLEDLDLDWEIVDNSDY